MAFIATDIVDIMPKAEAVLIMVSRTAQRRRNVQNNPGPVRNTQFKFTSCGKTLHSLVLEFLPYEKWD